MPKLTVFLYIFLAPFAIQNAVGQTGKRAVKEDSVIFLFPEIAFDSTVSTNRFVHPSGFTVRYTYKWNRDYSVADDLLIQLRNPEPNYPATFRETVSIVREVAEDSSKSLAEMAAMYASISEDTWRQYRINYVVSDSGEVKVNGQPRYYFWATLQQLSQEKLVVIIPMVNQFYIVEYTATNKTFAFFLQDLWKMINSCAFIQK